MGAKIQDWMLFYKQGLSSTCNKLLMYRDLYNYQVLVWLKLEKIIYLVLLQLHSAIDPV